MILLGKKKYTHEDQIAFGNFSGDINPIHVDQVKARTTFIGECIVHGVNVLLQSFEFLLGTIKIGFNGFETNFHRSIPLNKELFFYYDESSEQILIKNSNNLLYVSVKINQSDAISNCINITLEQDHSGSSLIDIPFEDCEKNKNFELKFRGNKNLVSLLFPNIVNFFGAPFVIDLACLSEIVGMRCPGLNSIILSLKVDFVSLETHSYSIIEKFNKLKTFKIQINGSSMSAVVDVLYRPTFDDQFNYKKLSNFIEVNEFSKVNALIIGGGRGLGAIVARIIVAGGGRVVISYRNSSDEAINLIKEIRDNTNSNHVAIVKIDVLNVNTYSNLGFDNINQIYYFASPKIKIEEDGINVYELMRLYYRYYISGFKKLLIFFKSKNPKISVFYPSTIYVEQPHRRFCIYAKIKAIGERCCDESLSVFSVRLPKIKTDQTISLFKEIYADPVDVFLPIIRKMSVY
jgi:hypothetical protein